MEKVLIYESRTYKIKDNFYNSILVEELSNLIYEVYAPHLQKLEAGRKNNLLSESKYLSLQEGLFSSIKNFIKKGISKLGNVWSRVSSTFKLGRIKTEFPWVDDAHLKKQTEKFVAALGKGGDESVLQSKLVSFYKGKNVDPADARVIASQIAKAAKKEAAIAAAAAGAPKDELPVAVKKADVVAAAGGVRGAESGDLAALSGRANDLLGQKVGLGAQPAAQPAAEPAAAKPAVQPPAQASSVNPIIKDVSAKVMKAVKDKSLTPKQAEWIRANIIAKHMKTVKGDITALTESKKIKILKEEEVQISQEIATDPSLTSEDKVEITNWIQKNFAQLKSGSDVKPVDTRKLFPNVKKNLEAARTSERDMFYTTHPEIADDVIQSIIDAAETVSQNPENEQYKTNFMDAVNEKMKLLKTQLEKTPNYAELEAQLKNRHGEGNTDLLNSVIDATTYEDKVKEFKKYQASLTRFTDDPAVAAKPQKGVLDKIKDAVNRVVRVFPESPAEEPAPAAPVAPAATEQPAQPTPVQESLFIKRGNMFILRG